MPIFSDNVGNKVPGRECSSERPMCRVKKSTQAYENEIFKVNLRNFILIESDHRIIFSEKFYPLHRRKSL